MQEGNCLAGGGTAQNLRVTSDARTNRPRGQDIGGCLPDDEFDDSDECVVIFSLWYVAWRAGDLLRLNHRVILKSALLRPC
jgi:hypothetical protein